ncbi:glutathione S-transferase domain-containing protein, partial [mine drainage metagenome]
LPFEEIRVDPWATPPELAAANPLSQVPTLITDAGEPLGNSDTILAWLEHTFPRPALLPADAAALTRAQAVTAIAQGLIETTVGIVLERRRTAEQQSAAMLDRRLATIRRTVPALAQRFDRAREHFHHDGISVACALAYLDLRLPEWDWRAAAPTLAEWQVWAEARASMRASAPLAV